MNNYEGYLIKFGNTVMPNRYFLGYSSTPDRITDDDAGTDQTGMLWRSPLPHKRTTAKFTTHVMELDDKIAFQSIILNAITNTAEDSAEITYWNDKTNNYSTATVYVPNIEFSVMDANAETILYNPITIELVEY
jgi:hypothetical protein